MGTLETADLPDLLGESTLQNLDVEPLRLNRRAQTQILV